MRNNYVEQRNDGYFVSGTRNSLDSVVQAFLCGESPERIVENFPLLKPAQVYGAIAFYLDNQAEIDGYLEEARRGWGESRGRALSEERPELWQRLQRVRTSVPRISPTEPRR